MQSSVARHSAVVFFQAEDGIRDYKVTGVQTCALPISDSRRCTRRCRGAGAGQVIVDLPLHPPDLLAERRRELVMPRGRGQIGRASCRERVRISAGAEAVTKKRDSVGTSVGTRTGATLE